MKLLANILSSMFHPLFMVTYGVILALTFTYLVIYPPAMKLLLVGGTFLLTTLIPSGVMYAMMKKGLISDMELSEPQERIVPYLIEVASIMVCTLYMYKMALPFWFISLLLGACVALILALVINFFWKISAHAIGIGGLLGGIMGVAQTHFINPYKAFIIVILLAGLIGSTRIFLGRHTPMQVYAGFCLGFICTFVASFLNYIYLFI